MDKREVDALEELAVISGKSFEETAEAFRELNEAMSSRKSDEKFANNRAGRRKEARKSRLRNDGSKKKVNG